MRAIRVESYVTMVALYHVVIVALKSFTTKLGVGGYLKLLPCAS